LACLHQRVGHLQVIGSTRLEPEGMRLGIFEVGPAQAPERFTQAQGSCSRFLRIQARTAE
jgi:hypothetical protein